MSRSLNVGSGAATGSSFSSRTFSVRITTVPTKILAANPNRSSYYIINQHANLAIYIASGTSFGSHVATAGNHEGERIGPNGGNVFDDDDLDEVWAISTGINPQVKILEKVKSGRLTR